MNDQLPLTIWLYGLPGSGKTTLANGLKQRLDRQNLASCILDGDIMRSGLNKDLGYDPYSRDENIRRAAEVAVIWRNTVVIPICAFITPEMRYRASVREI